MTDDKEREVLQGFGEMLSRVVVPIIALDHQNIPEVEGSGFVVRRGDANYLVTARHVLKRAENNEPLYLLKTEPTNLIKGQIRFLDRRPEFDTAVIRLEDYDSIDWEDRLPLRFEWLEGQKFPRKDNLYCIVGFPWRRSKAKRDKKEFILRPWGKYLTAKQNDLYDDLGFDRNNFLFLEFNRSKGSSLKGQRITSPEPDGMSGSPLWCGYDKWHPNDRNTLAVRGMLIEHRREHQLIIAVDAQIIIETILRAE